MITSDIFPFAIIYGPNNTCQIKIILPPETEDNFETIFYAINPGLVPITKNLILMAVYYNKNTKNVAKIIAEKDLWNNVWSSETNREIKNTLDKNNSLLFPTSNETKR